MPRNTPSVACSTAEALAWDKAFQGKNAPADVQWQVYTKRRTKTKTYSEKSSRYFDRLNKSIHF